MFDRSRFGSLPYARLFVFVVCLVVAFATRLGAADVATASADGQPPTDAKGAALELRFRDRRLSHWQATGDAFAGQPIKDDTVHARGADMRSDHAGSFWIGTFEVSGDKPQGTLTSRAFRVTRPYGSFLIAGGSSPTSRRNRARRLEEDRLPGLGRRYRKFETGRGRPTALVGKDVFVRLVDESSAGWGHLNFDDFRLHDTKPDLPDRAGPQPLDVYEHAGLDPQAAARAMTVPRGFRVTLFAGEPDLEQPIAQAIDDRGRLWVAEAYSYPCVSRPRSCAIAS